MFGNNLQIERIRAEARQELDGKDEQLVNQLWDWTYLVFQKWKLEHGDRNPIPSRGMLSDLAPIPFDKAEPWECSDFVFSSPVALAMKLLHENYPPLDEVTAKVGIRKVLALAIVKSEHAADDDLLVAGEILHAHANIEIGLCAGFDAAKKQTKENLATGRRKGSKSQEEYAAETWRLVEKRHKQFLKRTDYAQWKSGERAVYLAGLMGADPAKDEPLKGRHQPNGKPYMASTIQKRLAKMG